MFNASLTAWNDTHTLTKSESLPRSQWIPQAKLVAEESWKFELGVSGPKLKEFSRGWILKLSLNLKEDHHTGPCLRTEVSLLLPDYLSVINWYLAINSYQSIGTCQYIRTTNGSQQYRLQPPILVYLQIQHGWYQTLRCRCYITDPEPTRLTCLLCSFRDRLARSALPPFWKRKTSLMKSSLSTWRRRRIQPQNILRGSLSDKFLFSMTMAILFMVRVSMIRNSSSSIQLIIFFFLSRITRHWTIHCPEICQSRYPGLNSR